MRVPETPTLVQHMFPVLASWGGGGGTCGSFKLHYDKRKTLFKISATRLVLNRLLCLCLCLNLFEVIRKLPNNDRRQRFDLDENVLYGRLIIVIYLYTPRTVRACYSQSKFRILKIHKSSVRALLHSEYLAKCWRSCQRRVGLIYASVGLIYLLNGNYILLVIF